MKYSVLMPVYISDNHIWVEEAIRSVFNQTILPDEFVIICDGEISKEVNNILKKYKKKYSIVKIVKKEHSGLGLTLKMGVLECRNELIARIDSDDLWEENKMKIQLNYLEKHQEISLLGTNVLEFFDTKDNIVSLVSLPSSYDEIVRYSKYRNPFRHSSLIYKKSEVLKCGNYRDYPYFEDYDLWIRMIIGGCKCANIKENLTYMRVNNDFYQRRGGWKYLKIMKKFRKEYYKRGYFTFKSYFVSIFLHSLVCLVPTSIRKVIYKKALRNKV